jgi:G3E family GTPase
MGQTKREQVEPLGGRRAGVTILSGFLGAGKTTLLNQLLRQPGGRKIAVIVNDVGEVNIDGALIRAQNTVDGGAAGLARMVELTNGCVCCSIQEELSEAVANLARTGSFDSIVIEGTGAAEPLAVVKGLNRRDMWGRALMDAISIQALVTVVDVSLFDQEWEKIRQSDRRRRLLLLGDRRRPIFELLLEQVECADLILLNKTDRLSEEAVARVGAFIRELNERAEIRPCQFGQIDPEAILGAKRFEREATLDAPRWKRELLQLARVMPSEGAASASHEDKYGLTTFLYRARQPFDGKAFSRFVHHEIRGLLRAKGFYWVTERNSEVGLLSVAGDLVRSDFVGEWWVVRLGKGEAERADVPPNIEQNWDAACGDRRQEIVFIGVDMDESEIRRRLDACLREFREDG